MLLAYFPKNKTAPATDSSMDDAVCMARRLI